MAANSIEATMTNVFFNVLNVLSFANNDLHGSTLAALNAVGGGLSTGTGTNVFPFSGYAPKFISTNTPDFGLSVQQPTTAAASIWLGGATSLGWTSQRTSYGSGFSYALFWSDGVTPPDLKFLVGTNNEVKAFGTLSAPSMRAGAIVVTNTGLGVSVVGAAADAPAIGFGGLATNLWYWQRGTAAQNFDATLYWFDGVNPPVAVMIAHTNGTSRLGHQNSSSLVSPLSSLVSGLASLVYPTS